MYPLMTSLKHGKFSHNSAPGQVSDQADSDKGTAQDGERTFGRALFFLIMRKKRNQPGTHVQPLLGKMQSIHRAQTGVALAPTEPSKCPPHGSTAVPCIARIPKSRTDSLELQDPQ